MPAALGSIAGDIRAAAHLKHVVGKTHRAVATACGADMVASLCRYQPHHKEEPHHHQFHTVSFLLAGRLEEVVEGRRFELGHRAAGVKLAGVRHQDRWSDAGGLVFNLKIVADAERSTISGRGDAGWTMFEAPPDFPRLLRLCLLASDPTHRSDAAEDLLALLEGRRDLAAGPPPAWLMEVRDALEDIPASVRIDAAAAAVGVHRAHLCQMFRRHFGMSPSLYRQRVLVANALALAADGREPLGAVAAATGFSDQAHMTRRIVAHSGLTPGAIRRLFGDRRHSFKNLDA